MSAHFVAGMLLGLIHAATAAAGQYEIVQRDGRSLVADALGVHRGRHVALVDGALVPLRFLDVDFRETFHANADGGGGNVVFLDGGGWLMFEAVEADAGSVTVVLDDDRRITVQESTVDYRRTVLEAATLTLASDGGDDVPVVKRPSGRRARAARQQDWRERVRKRREAESSKRRVSRRR